MTFVRSIIKNKNSEKAWLIFNFIVFCTLIFGTPIPGTKWEEFPDTKDYKYQASAKIFSKDFLYPSPTPVFNPRPFTVPLFYKFVNQNDYAIVFLQRFIFCISVLFIIAVLVTLISNLYLKLFFTTVLFFYFSWWNISGWTINHLSESLSLSFMFIWIASLILYLKRTSLLNLTINLLAAFFFCFTRDSWPYLLVFTYAILLVYFLVSKKNRTGIIFAFSVIVMTFVFQNFTAVEGKRFKLPLFNSLAGRVSKCLEHVKWFTENGMPQSNQLEKDFASVDVESPGGSNLIYARYKDSTYIRLFQWIEEKGKLVYVKFLITHPSYTFLLNEEKNKTDKIVVQNLEPYITGNMGIYTGSAAVFSLFKPSYAVLLSILCIGLYFLKSKNNKLLVAPFMLLFVFVNVLLNFNADALELERHLFFTTVLLNLITLFGVFLLTDLFFEYSRKKRNKTGA